jgi:hypothetical protein
MLHVADLADLDVIVSDANVPEEFRRMIEKCDVECIFV